MERSSVIGIIVAFVAVIVAMFLKGVELSALFNGAAFTIIFGGTVAAIFMAFPTAELKRIPKLFKIIFKKQEHMSKAEIITLFVGWSNLVRREGLLALDSKLEEVDDPFLVEGLKLILDGNDQEFVKDLLLEEIHLVQERHKAGALIFSQAGTYAPTLGVLGAVIGLVASLANINDINTLGQSIAAAFIATLMGIFSGYLLWHPMSNKLKRLSEQEIQIKYMLVEGIISLQSGVSTIAMKQKLMIYVAPEQRNLAEYEENGGDTIEETPQAV
ncbi:flagellar motor stator protein MotA [Longirhabdus pacifica]|uniref:flagellar motor stator protein MotA n=1 Tax=Longirhabdus pacifica TaxID=2305227 RepID=UPI001008A162|nr:flagellar motor stator protein MotA [Longirhabdus pacifica]